MVPSSPYSLHPTEKILDNSNRYFSLNGLLWFLADDRLRIRLGPGPSLSTPRPRQSAYHDPRGFHYVSTATGLLAPSFRG